MKTFPMKKKQPADHITAANLQALIRLQYAARALPLSGAQVVRSQLVGRHRSSVRGRGMDFEELRHYRVGDDIRHMDWKVSNRTRKPHVRVYAEERERSVLLLVDQCQPMFFGSRRVMKSVAATEMAALVAWHVVQRGDRIGLLVYDDHRCSEVRPRRSQFQIMQILQQLCDYSDRLRSARDQQRGRLNAMLHRAQRLAGHNTLIYIISDLHDTDSETGELLTRLKQHNDVIIGLIHDPLEQSLPHGGRLAFSDGEYQLEIDTDNAQLRERYENAFAQRLEQARQFLHSRHIPIWPLSTHTPVAEQLLALTSPHGGTQ